MIRDISLCPPEWYRQAHFWVLDFSFSKVTALKVVWEKDTSRRSKEPGSDLSSCFSAWAPFCKCGWRHHISRSGCGPDWPLHSLLWKIFLWCYVFRVALADESMKLRILIIYMFLFYSYRRWCVSFFFRMVSFFAVWSWPESQSSLSRFVSIR